MRWLLVILFIIATVRAYYAYEYVVFPAKQAIRCNVVVGGDIIIEHREFYTVVWRYSNETLLFSQPTQVQLRSYSEKIFSCPVSRLHCTTASGLVYDVTLYKCGISIRELLIIFAVLLIIYAANRP